MINTLKLAATLKEVCHDSTNSELAYLKLDTVPGEIFQVDDSMMRKLCERLKQGIGLTEVWSHRHITLRYKCGCSN